MIITATKTMLNSSWKYKFIYLMYKSVLYGWCVNDLFEGIFVTHSPNTLINFNHRMKEVRYYLNAIN